MSTMNQYHVAVSDRHRERTVSARDAEEAARAVVGARLLTLRLAEWQAENGVEHAWHYEGAVRTGPTRGGATPFVNIRINVFREGGSQ